jgi:hypothetical protein
VESICEPKREEAVKAGENFMRDLKICINLKFSRRYLFKFGILDERTPNLNFASIIIVVVKQKRTKWKEHVARMLEVRN